MNGASEAEAVTRMALSATEMVARIALQGTVYMVRIAGRGSMELLGFLAAAAKSEKTAGKEKLATLLKSGSALKVFTFREDQMKQFIDAAKRYGIVYSVVKRDEADMAAGTYDVMVKADDASRINRILEKMEAASVDASVTGSEMSHDENEIADVRELLDFMLSKPEQSLENPREAVDSASLSTVSSSQQGRASVREQISTFKAEAEQEKEKNGQMLSFMLQQGGPAELDEEAEQFTDMIRSDA